MFLAGLILAVPQVVPFAPLIGQPRVAIERFLGQGQRISTSKHSEVFRYGEMEVEYANDKSRRLTRSFRSSSGLSWQNAMILSGYRPNGMTARVTREAIYSMVVTKSWEVSQGALPSEYRVTFTANLFNKPSLELRTR